MVYNYDKTINSPLNGKIVVWIGDSNTQYNLEAIKSQIESLGGTLRSYAVAGYAWENTDLADDPTVTNNSGIGQVNQAVNEFCSNNIFKENCIVIFMIGTNSYGEIGTFDDTSVSTVRGATDYCLKKIAYYGRNIPVGVILPWCGHDNTGLKERAEYYGFPVIDLEKECRLISDNKTSKYAEHAYLGTDGNHFGANGQKHFLRIIMNWIQYKI